MCIDSLSDADLLSPDRFSANSSRFTFQGSGGDGLRQDEISFQTAVRGILFNLPHPVKRTNPPMNTNIGRGTSLGQGAAHKMFYPTSLRLWRRKEELEELIDMVITKIQNGHLSATSNSSSSTKLSGVEAWRKNRYEGGPSQLDSSTASKEEEESAYSTALLGTGSSAKLEMLVDTLPYMTFIQKRKSTSSMNNSLRDLEKITNISANSRPLDEEDDERDADMTTEQWSTDKPVDVGKAGMTKKKYGIAAKLSDQSGVVKGKLESLVLEDDDIEDD